MSVDIRKRIFDFIVENFLFGDTEHDLTPESSLIENDVIDSTGVLELVAFIEEDFEISVDDSDIVPDNLDSVAAIETFIKRKQVDAQSAA